MRLKAYFRVLGCWCGFPLVGTPVSRPTLGFLGRPAGTGLCGVYYFRVLGVRGVELA